MQQKGCPGINVENKQMPMDGTRFPASVLRYMKLRDRVVHPVSYKQIEILGAPGE